MSAGLDWDLRTCVEHCTALTDTVESPHSPARHPRTAHRLGDSVRHPTPSSIFTPTASRADIEDDRTLEAVQRSVNRRTWRSRSTFPLSRLAEPHSKLKRYFFSE